MKCEDCERLEKEYSKEDLLFCEACGHFFTKDEISICPSQVEKKMMK